MPVVMFDLPWMTFNVGLALLAVGLGVIYLRSKPSLFRKFLFLVWFLFFPNTIYLITDLQYVPRDLMQTSGLEQVVLFLLFLGLGILGIVTYLEGIKPLGEILPKRKNQQALKNLIIIGFNFIVAFAVTIGKFQRTHSAYIFIDPMRVIRDVWSTLFDFKLLIFVLVFGILINTIYFGFKKWRS